MPTGMICAPPNPLIGSPAGIPKSTLGAGLKPCMGCWLMPGMTGASPANPIRDRLLPALGWLAGTAMADFFSRDSMPFNWPNRLLPIPTTPFKLTT